MSHSPRQILVTSALPYANGSLHLGHLVETIQTDIWVRFQRMQGNTCWYICGIDAHGTPIMLTAEREGISPETLIKNAHAEQAQDFKDFLIQFDNFYTTHSEESRILSELVYARIVAQGDVTNREIEQAFDPIKNMFLPDRYVKGECPSCSAPDQYGDSCEVCGATYSPIELKHPISAISGATPIQKTSLHYFFNLPRYTEFLKEWVRAGHLQAQMANKLEEWFAQGLKEWDISRDMPYFGFTIPGTTDKCFYVWLDAPIGYMASFKNFCTQHPEINFDDYWSLGTKTELYHFVGKDILYFHALFWPALLKSADFRLPTGVFAHGFLTVDGQKMSKSRGTFIKARDYLNHLDPEYLRYYIAAKSTSRLDDIDLNLGDFMQRVNADVVGKIVNIASRTAGFIHQFFEGRLASVLIMPALYDEFVQAGSQVTALYERREFGKVIRLIVELADKANRFIDEHKPWVLAKDPEQLVQLHGICSLALNLFHLIMLYLKPVLPAVSEKVASFLNVELKNFSDTKPLLDHSIAVFSPLLQRITNDQILALKTKY
jgi:methionyl-tRNA synthetase